MKKSVLSLLFLPLIATSLSGCGAEDYEIELYDVPLAYVNEEYDFSYCINQNEDYNYSINAYTYDLVNCVESELPVNNFKFTPVNENPISVVINADKKTGKSHIEKTVTLLVSEKGDPIEELLVTGGFSGYADTGFVKTLNTQPAYIHEGNGSKTSILVDYFGNNEYTFGGAVLVPNNFRCLPLWKDQNWSNPILRFWVYNNSEAKIEFGLRLKDEFTKSVDVDMGQEGNESKFAEPGKWTEIVFPLRTLGVTHTLYQSEDSKRNDSFTIKVRYHGIPEGKFTPMYSYSFYVDDIDVVPNTDYPDVPTYLPDTLDRFINQSWYENPTECPDSHFVRNLNFDQKYIHDGESSLRFKFEGKTNYNGTQGMCLNNSLIVPLWKDQIWSNAILTFWIYNDSDSDIEMQLYLKDSARNFAIDWNSEYSSSQIAEPHKWTQIFFSLNRVGVNSPLYKDTSKSDEFTVKFLGKGPANTSYEFYIDNCDVVPASDYPEVDTTRVVPERIETIDDGWENMEQDIGWEKGIITTEANEVCKLTYDESATSKKVEFANSDELNPDFAISPEGEFGRDALPDFSNAVLTFDVKFSSNITNKTVKVSIMNNPDGWAEHSVDVTLLELEGGWYHGSISYSSIAEVANFDQVCRIGFKFLGIDEGNKASAFAYIDNIFFVE